MSHIPITTTKEADLISALGALAVEHDKNCGEAKAHADGCPHAVCVENRVYMVAALMVELGCPLTDIGFIADALLDLEFAEVEAPAEKVDILDAKEISE